MSAPIHSEKHAAVPPAYTSFEHAVRHTISVAWNAFSVKWLIAKGDEKKINDYFLLRFQKPDSVVTRTADEINDVAISFAWLNTEQMQKLPLTYSERTIRILNTVINHHCTLYKKDIVIELRDRLLLQAPKAAVLSSVPNCQPGAADIRRKEGNQNVNNKSDEDKLIEADDPLSPINEEEQKHILPKITKSSIQAAKELPTPKQRRKNRASSQFMQPSITIDSSRFKGMDFIPYLEIEPPAMPVYDYVGILASALDNALKDKTLKLLEALPLMSQLFLLEVMENYQDELIDLMVTSFYGRGDKGQELTVHERSKFFTYLNLYQKKDPTVSSCYAQLIKEIRNSSLKEGS
ncbi:MAG: hypothetical protein JWO53_54 [Chlamydiia bacterium]|nr:hypothetical protein [Chlamydiia bacterium]